MHKLPNCLVPDVELVKKRMDPEVPHRECGDWADAGLASLYMKRVQTTFTTTKQTHIYAPPPSPTKSTQSWQMVF